MALGGGNDTYLSFMFPVAAATSFGAIFVADAGYGRLFRYDRATGYMSAISGVRVGSGTRMHTGSDGSLYLLDGIGPEIRRYSTNGSSLPTLHPRLESSRYKDFSVDQTSGHVLAADPLHRVIDRIEPLGRIAQIYLELPEIGPVASDGGAFLIALPGCKCVTEWRNGKPSRQLATSQLRLPQQLAVEAGEIYLLDGFDQSISRVHPGGVERIMPRQLNLLSPQHIAVSQGVMIVADGAGRSVTLFRIRRYSD
jgi:hypothetical protein